MYYYIRQLLRSEHTLVLLEVSTSDESCLRVCVRLREASANARVSSTGRVVSQASQPRQPLIPQTEGVEGRVDDEDDDDEVEGVGVATFSVFTTGGVGREAALAAAAKSEGDGERVVEGVAAAAVVAELDVRRGVFSMADNPGAAAEVEDALDRLDDDVEGWWLTAGRR